MKFTHTTRLLALTLFGLLCFCNISYGQSTNPTLARTDYAKSFQIDDNSRLKEEYTATITSLGLGTPEQAERFVARVTDNLTTYKVNAAENQVTVKLYLNRAPASWTAQDWNKYINNKFNSL